MERKSEMEEISVVRDESELERLSVIWNELLEQSSNECIFLTWEWIIAWWRTYGKDMKLWIVKIQKDGNLVGLAPLYRRRFRKFGIFTYCGLFLIGDGSADSDYLDIIAKRGEEEFVVRSIVRFLLEQKNQWDLFFLSEIPETSKNIGLFRQYLREQEWHWKEDWVPCAYVDISSNWDEYLGLLKPRMRTKLRSLIRNLDQTFRVCLVMCSKMEELKPRLDSLYDLHNRRWGQNGEEGVFVSEAKRQFYQEMSSLFLSRGLLRFYSLIVNGWYVAHQFCFEYQNKMFLLQEGYDPKWTEYGVGNVLRAHVFRDCIERKVSVYDFLGGVTSHKLSWGAQIKYSLRISTGPSKLKNGVFFYVPYWIGKGKEGIKRILPGPTLRWSRIFWGMLRQSRKV